MRRICISESVQHMRFGSNVGYRKINHSFGNGLYHLFMVKLWIVYCYFGNIIWKSAGSYMYSYVSASIKDCVRCPLASGVKPSKTFDGRVSVRISSSAAG